MTDAPWADYNGAQVGRGIRPLCLDVLSRAGDGDGRLAVDLGCGAGIEAVAMLDRGWRVLAVDSDPTMPVRLLAHAGDDGQLVVHLGPVETVSLPPASLVHASFSLPFLEQTAFDAVWRSARAALQPGGWLAADLFGDRDGWVGEPGMTFHSRAQVEYLLEGLDVEQVDEDERDAGAYGGPKHWHVFHIIAREPLPAPG